MCGNLNNYYTYHLFDFINRFCYSYPVILVTMDATVTTKAS